MNAAENKVEPVAEKTQPTTSAGKPSEKIETDKKDEEGGPCGLPKSCNIL